MKFIDNTTILLYVTQSLRPYKIHEPGMETNKYFSLNPSSNDAIIFKIYTYNIKQNHCQIFAHKT